MPHLDANALSIDPDGMEFLASVLDVAPVAPRPWGAFDVKPNAASSLAAGFEADANRARYSELVSEPA